MELEYNPIRYDPYDAVNDIAVAPGPRFLERCKQTYKAFRDGCKCLDDQGKWRDINDEARLRDLWAMKHAEDRLCDVEVLRMNLHMCFYRPLPNYRELEYEVYAHPVSGEIVVEQVDWDSYDRQVQKARFQKAMRDERFLQRQRRSQ